jgi:hypothetical protein
MRVAIPDERIEVDESKVMAAGGNAKDGIEGRDRLINDDVETPALEVALVLGQEEYRFRCLNRTVESEFDTGLRGGGRGDKGREQSRASDSTKPGWIASRRQGGADVALRGSHKAHLRDALNSSDMACGLHGGERARSFWRCAKSALPYSMHAYGPASGC